MVLYRKGGVNYSVRPLWNATVLPGPGPDGDATDAPRRLYGMENECMQLTTYIFRRSTYSLVVHFVPLRRVNRAVCDAPTSDADAATDRATAPSATSVTPVCATMPEEEDFGHVEVSCQRVLLSPARQPNAR